MRRVMQAHLGSIRLKKNISGAVLSERNYSAFGETIQESVTSGKNKRYRFTDKERDDETNMHYFGVRYYDAEVGRWNAVDPMFEKYFGWSSYNYCVNNPIKCIYPDGKNAEVSIKGNVINIKVNIFLTGNEASSENAQKIQSQIMSAWNNGTKGQQYKDGNDVYSVNFDVNVKCESIFDMLRIAACPSSSDNVIELEKSIPDNEINSHVAEGSGGIWYTDENAASHEF